MMFGTVLYFICWIIIPIIGFLTTITFIYRSGFRKLSTYHYLLVSLLLPILMIYCQPIPRNLLFTTRAFSASYAMPGGSGGVIADGVRQIPTIWSFLFTFLFFFGVPVSFYFIRRIKNELQHATKYDYLLADIIYILATLIFVILLETIASCYA